MKKLLNSNILLIVMITIFAVTLSEILVYLQLEFFWDKSHDDKSYSLGLWTPLIDSILVILLLLFIKSFYEKELKRKNLVLEEAKKIAKLGEWELNIDKMEAHWSDNITNMFGLDGKEKAGPDLLQKLMYKEDWKTFESSLNNCILGNSDHSCMYKIKRADNNKTVYIECKGKLYPQTNTILGTVQDITEIKRNQKQIDNYINLIDKNIVTSSTDLDGNITSVSKAFCEISGYTKEELLGKTHRIIRHPDMDESLYKEIWETITDDKTWVGEIKNIAKDRSSYWVKASISPIFDEDGQKIGYTAIRQDITNKKRLEEISITDALTNIYNRRYFNSQFPKIINSAKRENELISFLILDIDFFKQYNDTYGHQRGDDVLIEVASCLKDSLKRADDYCFRLGGEEFGIIFKTDTKEKALSFAQTIKESIENLKIHHEKSTVSSYITVSSGLISLHAKNIESLDGLYKQADDLLYKAKNSGKNKTCSV